MNENKLFYLIISMRPKQWTKNFFVFAGLIFSKSFLQVTPVLRSIYTFLLFSLVSGTVYIINDILDREKDSLHPRKCKRPIASGKIKPFEGLAFAFVVLILSLVPAFLLEKGLFLILLGYFVLVTAYSLKLKNFVIVDVILISLGFVFRTVGGAVAIHVYISPWLIACTSLLALFLALNKRKNELLVLSGNATGHRKALEQYTPELIDQMLGVVTSATVMSYLLYTFNSGKSPYMMLTFPFVLYGIFRYQYLVSIKDLGGSPELILLHDKPLLADILLWGISSAVIVWKFY